MSEEGKKAALAIAEQMRVKDERIRELEDALSGVTRIVEAYSYTNTLGRTQRARYDFARAALAKAGPR